MVVIAIIGILASVVLASLNTARGKGADAAIKSNLNNVRAQAELFYDSQSPSPSYIGVCTNVATMTGAATTAGATGVKCAENTNLGWAVEGQLKGDTTKWYCVDSSGLSALNTTTKITAGAASGDYSCL